MSDEQANVTGAAPAPEKKPGLFSTPTGRIVGIVVGLGVLGIIVGVAIAIVMFVFADKAVDELQTEILEQTQTDTGSTTSTETVVAAGPAAEIPNSQLFTFRNIFEPLLKPIEEVTTTPSSTTTATPDTDTPDTANVLYLDGVVTEEGIMKAVLRYNGATYTLGPGESIPNTPWAVLRVSSTSVTMLYGDIQVTLAVGQGITK